MHGTTAGFRTEAGDRLAALARERPEWREWLRLLAEVEHGERTGGRADGRTDARLVGIVGSASAAVGTGAPLLHGRTIVMDIGGATHLVRRLASLAAMEGEGAWRGAATLAEFRPSEEQVVELLQRAMRQEPGGAVGEGDRDAGAVRAIAELAALPLLRGCAGLLEAHVPAHWPHGYCPICAAWPILVEHRGLDRARWARCGRCGGQWRAEWLRCVYCGEREHERLGSLVPEEGGEVLKVEVCATCRGYVKTVTTLQAQSPLELLLRDLETIELDLVALERGYERPAPGFHPEVRLVARSA
ncbi:MAG TPA: formate dehydrogenase accessory protein FdhE [Gemmatimonadales bacterium]